MSLVIKPAGAVALDAGDHTTVAAVDTVQTGLAEVLYVTVIPGSAPEILASLVTVAIPDQVANPGKITISSWRPTSNLNPTPIAATAFSKSVLWLVLGR